METEKRLKMLQLFYAGVLADSIRNYSEAGILGTVESKKEKEQKLAAKGQLAQLNISTPPELFNTFSEIFGCISWNIEEKSGKITARGNFCMLCAIAKKMDIEKPCNMYCINPFNALIEGLENGYKLRIRNTLWESNSCEFEVISKRPIEYPLDVLGK